MAALPGLLSAHGEDDPGKLTSSLMDSEPYAALYLRLAADWSQHRQPRAFAPVPLRLPLPRRLHRRRNRQRRRRFLHSGVAGDLCRVVDLLPRRVHHFVACVVDLLPRRVHHVARRRQREDRERAGAAAAGPHKGRSAARRRRRMRRPARPLPPAARDPRGARVPRGPAAFVFLGGGPRQVPRVRGELRHREGVPGHLADRRVCRVRAAEGFGSQRCAGQPLRGVKLGGRLWIGFIMASCDERSSSADLQ
ncbi:hypothetical protein DFJ74DRAFT_667972 [Hyaloraphidium curvatum]|nr:hypothetical protein DFJ74DRAFT_667972 [Hyaloraphidium curvatum]